MEVRLEAFTEYTRRPRKLSLQSRMRIERLKLDPKAWALTLRVAAARRVSLRDLLHGGRHQGNVALSRQLAMYLVHVLLRRTQEEVGFLFTRSRTTVGYACRNIEMMRDDPLLEAEIERIEGQCRQRVRPLELELRDAA